MANQSGRPVAPARKLMAAVLGTIAVFVMLFGLGLSSWSIVALGVALLALAIALAMVNVVRRGARAWVAGTVQVKAVSQPPASSVYGRAELSVVVIAPGLPIQEVTIRDPRVPVEKWPRPGDTLPVSVDVDDMRRVRIDWDDAPSRADSPDLNPPPPAYDVDNEDIADDDLLDDVEPPPWATRDRQWGLGPDEPPPPPPPSPRSGDDMDDVVVHDTPAGPIVEGQLVGADDRPGPLPQRARPAPGQGRTTGARPSPHPRAATATVDPETEAPGRWSDNPQPRSSTPEAPPEARPAPPQAAAAPAPGQRHPEKSRPAPEQPVTATHSAPPTPEPATEAPTPEPTYPEPYRTAPRQTTTESPAAHVHAPPEPAQSRPTRPKPTATPTSPTPTSATPASAASASAARASAGPTSAAQASAGPTSAAPQPSRAYPEPQPVRPYAEPRPETPPATAPEPERPLAAATAGSATAPDRPETRGHDGEIDLDLDDAPEPPPPTRSLYLNISIPKRTPSAGDTPTTAAEGAASADDLAATHSTPQTDPAQPTSTRPAPGAPSGSAAPSSSGIPSASGAGPQVTPITAFSMPGPSAPPARGPAERAAPAPAGNAATSQSAPDDRATSPRRSGDAAASGGEPPTVRTGSPWAELEGGFEPDERADDLITAYPSARPGPAGAIHGVGITVLVTNLERSIAFYRDILGFFEIDSSAANAVLASGDTRLVLRTVHDLSAEAGRLIYLNLEVGDVEAVYQELKSKGVPFVHGPRPVNRGDKLELWAASFSDPDRHNIAITQWRAIR